MKILGINFSNDAAASMVVDDRVTMAVQEERFRREKHFSGFPDQAISACLKSGGAPKLIIIATGSEVGLAIEAREQLEAEGTPTRVVSMPCWELFDVQSAEYRESVLPKSVKARLAVEAGVSLGWAKYVGDEGDVLAVDRFGSSAPADVVFREYGFTVENVVAMAKSLV